MSVKYNRVVKRNKDLIVFHMKQILDLCGLDVESPELVRTPERFWEVLEKMTRGFEIDVLLNRTYEDAAKHANLRILPAIPFVSICEHHLMPFYGDAVVAYVPKGRVTGLSKIPQLVEKYSLRPQLQERLTEQIAEELDETLDTIGVIVITEARHTCMLIEGYTAGPYINSSVRGEFRETLNPRDEVLQILQFSKSSQVV